MDNNATPQQKALFVLKSISKSIQSAVQLDSVPDELCIGEAINLDRWTMILNDDNLKIMSKQPSKCYVIDPSKPAVSGMFEKFYELKNLNYGLLNLSMKGAKDITDYGLSLVIRSSPHLKHLDITGCTKITDVSMRELGMNCKNLLSLIISSCHSIYGEGIIAVGDSCRQLRKLNISRCKNLERFALVKMFVCCTKLEELDITNFNNIGDDEVRVLAQSCPNFMTFIAADSPHISDQSILAITQNCPEIDSINLSRQSYSFKVSDVSLLALGQRAYSLRSLILNGCEHLTDVGLNWLTEGCKAIEELNLCGCSKLTDAAVRNIGNNCHSLKSLDISHAQLVSDVGIAQVAFGCPDLKTIKCHGLFYLSDPRIPPPKKGSKLEAWEAVVGIPAVAESLKHLEEADFSGCFRLNICLKRNLSSVGTLKVLNLMGCNQTSTESLVAIARGCRLLEELTLTDCGKSVNGTSMDAFGEHCNRLRILILARCTSLDGKAMGGIAKCDRLEKLDISGCSSLTDLRMLPICETDKVPQLSHLNIVNIPKLTDTTLSWVANGCPSLLIFAFKGTSITKPGAKAVRDNFPFCDMIFNDNFSGFWPKTRIDDRKLLNNFYHCRKGITGIQSRARTSFAKIKVKQMEEKRKKMLASFVISSTMRIYIAKKICRKKRYEIKKMNRHGTIIISFFRMIKAKARVRRIKNHHIYLFKCKKAEIIQRTYRLHLLWVKRLNEARIYFQYLRLRYNSARTIQSIIRMQFKGIRTVKRKWELIYATRALHERKALFLQRCYRGYKVRCRVKILLEKRNFARKMYLVAVKKVQKTFRIYRTNTIVRLGTLRRKTKLSSSIKIQKIIRGFLARLLVQEIKTDILETLQNQCAIKIQRVWKNKSSKIDFMKLQSEIISLNIQRDIAATVFAKYYRKKLAYRALLKLKERKKDGMRRKADVIILSATKIQSLYRGMRGRIEYDNKRREKKGKWKELFDDEKQKRFFYNKLTGEIRWRMPRDLLDLIPTPVCDNCEFYEASLECAVCSELFCSQCWNQIHYGGRRKDHEFRSLYDYYGKRIDYGDGVFPCKWPTEVIQDEIQGWMLRVAPIRDPTAKYGDWEEYVDPEGVKEGSQYLKQRSEKGISSGESRLFFFNRKTYETTYEEPQEVSQLKNTANNFNATDNYDFSNTFGTEFGYTGYYDASGNWIAADYSSNDPAYTDYSSSRSYSFIDTNYDNHETKDPGVLAIEESYSLTKTPKVSKRNQSGTSKAKKTPDKNKQRNSKSSGSNR